MKKNQSGFGAIEALLIIIILILLGVVGCLVYKNQHKPSTSTSTSISTVKQSSSANSPATQPTKSTAPSASSTYLNIPEWGIKVKLGTADPSIVTYKYNSSGGDDISGVGAGFVTLSLKSSVTTDSSCQSLGVGIDRHLVSSYDSKDLGGSPTNVVGDYYFTVGGSPYSCQNTQLDAIRSNYTGNNPSSWVYSSAN